MSNIFIHKDTSVEVNLIHVGKMKISKETVAIYEVEQDRTILVMPLNDFNQDYEQDEFSKHDHFTEDGL